jgi:hypothetical protein
MNRIALLVAGLFAAACTGDGSDGNPSSGVASGGRGGGGQGGSTGGDGGSAGGPQVGGGGEGGTTECGNGVAEPPEGCDHLDFGGLTCATFGLGPGELVCNGFCHVVVSGCGTPESCLNGLDDDGDGFIDCTDSDCGGLAQCLDSCAAPDTLVPPAFLFVSSAGRPDTYQPSCTATSGPERIFEVTASANGALGVSAIGQADFTVAVTTACGEPMTELACASFIHHPSLAENVQFPVTAGGTYFVVVDGLDAGEEGFFSLGVVAVTAPESSCDDLVDDDFDGALDCDDGDCQQLAVCASGALATGSPCTASSQCAASPNDPVCLPDFWGFTGGYCSQYCDLETNDCGGDGICFDYGISQHGTCLDGCVGPGDCRPGYACRDLGLATKVCYLPPESACNDHEDDDFDQLTDCEDPDCQATIACTPGPAATGSPCIAHADCAANQGGDPYCVSFDQWGWPDGYCAEFCDFTPGSCAPDALCIDYFFWPSGAGNCLKTCSMPIDCPPGYMCSSVGGSTSACIF